MHTHNFFKIISRFTLDITMYMRQIEEDSVIEQALRSHRRWASSHFLKLYHGGTFFLSILSRSSRQKHDTRTFTPVTDIMGKSQAAHLH